MILGFKKIISYISVICIALATAASAAEHPKLYFSTKDLKILRSQVKGEKATLFARLRHWGDTHLEESPPADIDAHERDHESCFSVITNYGVLYQITGEKKYLEAGIKWIEALINLPSEGENYFVIGEWAASLAHGYDLYYSGLSPVLRSALKEKLIQVLEQTRYGASRDWWSGIYTHHDFWIPFSFMGVAAVCLQGEYAGADSIARFAAQELKNAMALLGDLGYWPEGVADWVYGMSPAMMFFDALQRSGGPDFYENLWMKNTARARLMHWLPGGKFMHLGDSFPSGRYGVLGSVSAHLLMRLAGRYHDGYAQWLALKEAEIDSSAPPINSLENPYSFGTKVPVLDRERHGLAWQVLWYDPSVKPLPPDNLPTDVFYPNWDTAVFRAGWGPGDPVIAFAGGHLLGRAGTAAWKAGNRDLPGGLAHTHQNAGALYLWADGHYPIMPPGFGGRDGRFHSTVMVDGHGQLFDPDFTGKVTAFESGQGWAMAAMDLTGAYPKDVKLSRFVRTLVFLKPRTILILDRLVTNDGDKNYIRRYEWLLQTDASSARWTTSDNTLKAVPLDNPDSTPWLIGKVFPSYRYYFEHQSMYRPDGMPMNRALSVTILGRMRARVQIAALLHVPAPDEDTGWLHRVSCEQNPEATTLVVPDGPYFIIPTGPQGNPTRSVVFAQADSVTISGQVPNEGLLLVVDLPKSRKYRLETAGGDEQSVMRLVPDPDGQYMSSEAGNLLLRTQPKH